jgi:hypothetical protein
MLGLSGVVVAEQIECFGDYTTSGTVHGDLIVVNGNVVVAGDLVVNGDLKVTAGCVVINPGALIVLGDLIVTNTNLVNPDATVSVYGDLSVSGALITKSTYGQAYAECYMPGSALSACRVSLSGLTEAYLWSDHHITVTGSIVTKSLTRNAYVESSGQYGIGDVNAGSIMTYAPAAQAYISVDQGNLTGSGDIITRAYDDASIFVAGKIDVGSIFAYSEIEAAFVSGERVLVHGDIRTIALAGDASVKARKASIVEQEGTYEDIIANNLYARGYESAAVDAYRSVELSGDMMTWQTEAAGRNIESRRDFYPRPIRPRPWPRPWPRPIEPPSPPPYPPFVQPGGSVSVGALVGRAPTFDNGWLKAKNIIAIGRENGAVEAAGGIEVTGDIVTKSEQYAHVYTYSEGIYASNIATEGVMDAFVHSELGEIYVSNIITTTNPVVLTGRPAFGANGAYIYAGGGDVTAEKIFTDGQGNASVYASNAIAVKGPITTKSTSDNASVYSIGSINAGAINTSGNLNSSVRSDSGAITVDEDIYTNDLSGDGYVASYGDLQARSIKSVAPWNDSIQSVAGKGTFQLVIDSGYTTSVLLITNAEFDLDTDYELNTALSLDGTCTINGKGHFLNFGSQGAILVTPGSTLLLKNIDLRNIGGSAIGCYDDTATLSVQDVVWTQTSDTLFSIGGLQIIGNLTIKGPGTAFAFTSDVPSAVYEHTTLMFDHGVTFSYAAAREDLFNLVDLTARIYFDGATFEAVNDCRFIHGTLAFDDVVTLSVEDGASFYLGNGDLYHTNDVVFEYSKATKVIYRGNLVNQGIGELE